MSVEQATQELAAALVSVMEEIVLAAKGEPSKINIAGAAKSAVSTTTKVKPPTKAELKELHEAGKTAAAAVLRAGGKPLLMELLGQFKIKKYADIEKTRENYAEFVSVAKAIVKKNTAVEVTNDDPLASAPETTDAIALPTIEDVKNILLKVQNHPGLGKDVTRQLLTKLGVTRLPELTEDKYKRGVEIAQKALNAATITEDDDMGLE